MENFTYKITNDSLIIELSTKTKGKFRWKNRLDNSKVGKSFKTISEGFMDDSYLEWLIGYDTTLDHPTKETFLNNLIFTGANGKNKNPYEISEILFLLIKNNIILKQEIISLLDEINTLNFYLDERYNIESENSTITNLVGIDFHKHDVILPTLSYYEDIKGISIEISIQKQQYAYGVQPMLYFIIPIQKFNNYYDLLEKTSKDEPIAIFEINSKNKHFILNMFKYFSICSRKHKHDIIEILKLIINNI